MLYDADVLTLGFDPSQYILFRFGMVGKLIYI